ncbi:MAG: hypothetical protein Q7S58_10355 [Candidatus Binatus sp.]|uniref:hypothetical protein n=1 Tax=Candidatus Binatus sp. TaxID=2811406 RepID=UPI00271CB859|nr:hypothetical protein [Candidatus Binatus sp.]MDO8432794.1 hypothetical protein [Candidatus Binatus sp.]
MTNSAPYQVAFENEYVRIVHVNLAAGQDAPKYTPVAMPMVRVDLNSGQTHYLEHLAEVHDDAGKTAVREIRVELKSAPKSEPLELDAVRLDPARYTVDFQNDRVRIVRLGFAPHERGLMVSHPPRVLVTLTDVAVKLKFLDGRTDERGAPAGLAGWLETETLQTENARDQPLQVVLVEPKSGAF